MFGNETKAYMHDNWRDDIKRLKDVAEEIGIKFVQAHSPAFETLETLDPNENWDEKLQETIRSIEICAELDIPYTVVHAGVKRNTGREETIKLNKEFYKLLFPVMEKTGVYVLTENAPCTDNQGRYYFNSGERLAELVDYINHPLLKACWDIGHGNFFGSQYKDIIALGDRIKAIHYNDNCGGPMDLHTMPFLGTLDNDDAIRGVIDIGYKGAFTFESPCMIKEKVFAFDKKKGQNGASIGVVRAMEKALYESGKYLLTTYNLFED
jgi:sugar phosphate isomerase/epimerase